MQLGPFFLLSAIVSWQVMGMIGTNITESFKHYYFIVWFFHNTYLFAGLFHAFIYCCKLNRGIKQLQYEYMDLKLHIMGAIGSILSMVASLSWYYSLPITILSANNAIYQTTPLFVFILSILFLKETVTCYKILGLSLCAIGVFFVSYFTHNQVQQDGYIQKSELIGYLFVLCSAFTLAFLEIAFEKYKEVCFGGDSLYRSVSASDADKQADLTSETLFSLRYICLLGFYNLVMLGPGIIFFDGKFELPPQRVLSELVIVAFLELAYNISLFCGISVSSSVFMAVGQILLIPVGYLAEILLKGKSIRDHSIENYIGAAFITVGFLVFQNVLFGKRKTEEIIYADD